MGGSFAGVVDEEDGGVKLALERAQEGEQGRDSGDRIFVDGMQTDERIEDKEARLGSLDGGLQARTVAVIVEAHDGGGNEVKVEGVELELALVGNGLEALVNDVEGIFSGEEEHTAGPGDTKATQAGSAGGHGGGDVQSEQGFSTLGLSAQDTAGVLGPELFDEPGRVGGRRE
jgi:hypothetical protein